MSNLVERLRHAGHSAAIPWQTAHEAADEIERLQAALQKYGMHGPNCYPPNADGKGELCLCGFSAALSGKEKEKEPHE